MSSNRCFENVKALIEYAWNDIERFNTFTFKYETTKCISYNKCSDGDEIKEIDEDNFEFNDMVFNLDFVEPCC